MNEKESDSIKIEVAKSEFPKGKRIKVVLTENNEKDIMTTEEIIDSFSKNRVKEEKILKGIGVKWVIPTGKYKISDFSMPCVEVEDEDSNIFYVSIINIIEK